MQRSDKQEPTFEGWAILELMGHRKPAGMVSEVTLAGGAFIRIDVPGEKGPTATQFYSPAAVYCITPTTENLARAFAQRAQPEPVTRWELPSGVTGFSKAVAETGVDEQDDNDGGVQF